jgi:hypothetical protein
MRADDSAGHPYPRQGDRDAVRGKADSADDPLPADPAAGAAGRSKPETGNAAPPQPMVGGAGSVAGRPSEEKTTERVEVEQDSASDSG